MPSALPADERKVVFITGCSSGIGRALALEFAQRPASGWHSREEQENNKRYRVFAGARNLESLRDLHPYIERIKIDVNDEDAVKRAVEDIIREAGKIDILINNAGVNMATGVTVEISLDKVRATFETNYFGLLRVVQAVSPDMIKRKSGTIINIGSIAAYGNFPFSAAYSSSKAAVHSLNDALRSELQPFNVRVLLVAPGAIKSSFGDSAMSGIEYPSKGSPYANAKAILEHRSSVSQQDSPTQASVLAQWIRKESEKSSIWQRHYLTAGRKSFLGWLIYYFPPFLRDTVLFYFFKLNILTRRS
ncbi:hypothetical protein CBS101457_003098 [Exobasidium rhododendri]|nr:hypothetical protein CBS101457_003098 [Exobasidium rhododendri]